MNNEPISKINSILTIDYLKNNPEGQYFERKGLGNKDTKPSKIAEEIIGMLNADGGILVFGLSDNGEIQNLKSLDVTKLNQFRTLVIDYITPACTVEREEVTINENLIFIYHINQDVERIFYRKDNEQYFLRVLDTNRKLDLSGIKKLEYDKNIRRFEEEIVKTFEIEDLDEKLLDEFKEKTNYKGDVLDLLSKKHLLKKEGENYLFYNSAILLFAKDPEKYIPSASVRYIRYDGNEPLTGTNHNVIKDERFEDNIPRLIIELKNFLRVSFKDYYFLDIEKGSFKKVPEYPEEAWLEGIVNALTHRSYNIQGNSIYIKHFDNRIEISNSGPLPAQVSIENIKYERFSRNPRIARTLEDLGYVRQLNEGVPRIYESMERSMLSEPEYREQNGTIYLILKNKISSHTRTIKDTVMNLIEEKWSSYNTTQKKLLEYLFRHNKGTIGELSDYVNIQENTLRSYLNNFISDSILERKSTKKRDRNAIYIFSNDL